MKYSRNLLYPEAFIHFNLDNLGPISLTSCLGKLAERMLLRRLQPYLEAKDLFPNTMYGFRKHLCMQGILLYIKGEILMPAFQNPPTAILALHLKGAFENVSHSTILSHLNETGCSLRTYT